MSDFQANSTHYRLNRAARRRPAARFARRSLFSRATALVALFAILHVTLSPMQTLFAQPVRGFAEMSRSDVDRYVDRASRLTDVDAWTNYVATGVAQERIEWEEAAYDALQREFANLEQQSLSDSELADQRALLESQYESAQVAWETDASQHVLDQRGRYRGQQAAITVEEITADEYESLIAAVEAEATLYVNLDLAQWDALITQGRDGFLDRFESGLDDALDAARSALGGVSPEERAAFENELDQRAAELRQEFEFRDHFYTLRARNSYVARMRSDDVSARLLADSNSADAIAEQVLAGTRAQLDASTEDMLASAGQQIADLSASDAPNVTALDGLADNWEKQIEDVISSGLRRWDEAEEELYRERLTWQAEAKRSREEGERIWKANHEKLEAARTVWLADVRQQINAGRDLWEQKFAEFAESRAAAESELDRYITEERARRTATMDRFGELVRGGGSALLEAKDAYFYYDSLLAELQAPAADCNAAGAYDNQLYCFYLAQRDQTANSIARFQAILGDSETALAGLMHSTSGDTGFLSDRRAYAGDLPQTIAALGVSDFETNLRAQMQSRGEDYLLYQRDISAMISGNALFVENARNLTQTNAFDYAGANSVAQLQRLVDGLAIKYDDHRAELNRLIARDRGALDAVARLAAIKDDIANWFVTAQDRDARLRGTVLNYFNNGLAGFHLTADENDPYLMTQAEYDWERLRRERNYLAKRLDTATAVKRYADLAREHEAGLEMAQITAERADVTKVRRDLRELQYLFLKGDLTVDPSVATDPTMRDSEFERLFSERGIDPGYLTTRETFLLTEIDLLADLIGGGRPTAGEISAYIQRIDQFLVTNVPEAERATHRLTGTRAKLLTFSEIIQGGASEETKTNRWQTLVTGFDALHGELNALNQDYDFNGLRAEFDAFRMSIADPTLRDRRDDLYTLREQLENNATTLAAARTRLDQARADYSLARKDFEVLRAGNAEELIRENLLETTGQLAGVLNQMTRIENLPGFDANSQYDAIGTQRAEYLYAVSGRQTADQDFARSSDLLKFVRGLEAAKNRTAALENVLAGVDPTTIEATALADLFLNTESNLITRDAPGEPGSELSSYQRTVQLFDNLRAGRSAFVAARDALTAGQNAGESAANIEVLRADVARARERIIEIAEQLIANIRGEETVRTKIVQGLFDPAQAPTAATVSQAQANGIAQMNQRGLELSRDAANDIRTYLDDNRESDFATLLRTVNDQLATAGRVARTDLGALELAGAADRVAVRRALLRDWLIQNRALIEQANAAPDQYDSRSVAEKWDRLLSFVGTLATDANYFEEFAAAIPDDADHAWVVAFRADRTALLSELDGVLASPDDATLTAAYASLNVTSRESLAHYGSIEAGSRRADLERVRHSLRLDLAALDYDYRSIYLREENYVRQREVTGLGAELARQGAALENQATERRALNTDLLELSAKIAAETDPVLRAELETHQAAVQARVDVLTQRIADLEPIVRDLEIRYRRAANTLREIQAPGSSAPLLNAALNAIAGESAGLQLFGRLRETPRLPDQAVTETALVDQLKAIIGFYETDARGAIMRDANGAARVSPEFQALNITDPNTALENVLAGNQRGDHLQRWSNRLVSWLQDPAHAEGAEPEIVAAVGLLANAVQEYRNAVLYIEHRDTDSATLIAQAGAQQTRARGLLAKLELFATFEQSLQEAATQARLTNDGDPTGAMLAVIESPEFSEVLSLFAGFSANGTPDGIADAELHERALEIQRLAERLRENRRNQFLAQVADNYGAYMTDYIDEALAAADPDAITPPSRADFIDAHPELNATTVRLAIQALPADDEFRANLRNWLANAPNGTALFRDAVADVLSSTPGTGSALKDAVLARLSNLQEEVEATLAFYLDDVDLMGERDVTARVDSTVSAAIARLFAESGFSTEELARVSDEVYERELRRALYLSATANTYVATDYPEELRELILVRQFSLARDRYTQYQTGRASTLQSEREETLLDLRGLGGDFARYVLATDFESYRNLAPENSTAGFIDAAQTGGDAADLAGYVATYLNAANTAPGLLPESGALLYERAAMHEYVRLYGDGNDAGGIHNLDETAYLTDFADYIRLAMIDAHVTTSGFVFTGVTETERRAEFRVLFEAALDAATYTRDGRTLRARLLSSANIDALFERAFAHTNQGDSLEIYLPASLEVLHDPVPAVADLLPADLTAIAGYETIDYRTMATAVHAGYDRVLATLESQAALTATDIRFGLDVSDADLDAILARAGYVGATRPDAAARTEIYAKLRAGISAAYFAQYATEGATHPAQLKSQALQTLREDRALRSLFADDATRKQTEIFLAGRAPLLTTIEDRFLGTVYSNDTPRSSALIQATAESRGDVLRAIIELSRNVQTPFFTGLDAALQNELQTLAQLLFGNGASAFTTEEQAALLAAAPDFARAIDVRAATELAAYDLFAALEAAADSLIQRGDADLRAAAAGRENEIARALAESVYVTRGVESGFTNETTALFAQIPGLELSLTTTAAVINSDFAGTLIRDRALVLRFLNVIQESAAERAHVQEIFSDPALINPAARLDPRYQSQRALNFSYEESARLGQALLVAINGKTALTTQRLAQSSQHLADAAALARFANLRGDDPKLNRFSNYRTYVGSERSYQDAEYQAYLAGGPVPPQSFDQFYGGLVLEGESLGLDPRALFDGAQDWQDLLRSDDPATAMVRSVDLDGDGDASNDPRIVRIRSVTDETARIAAGDADAQFAYVYRENLANTYLEAVSRLNAAFVGVFASATMAGARGGDNSNDNFRTLIEGEYNVTAAAGVNDLSALESRVQNAAARQAQFNDQALQQSHEAITTTFAQFSTVEQDFADSARRKHIARMGQSQYITDRYAPVALEMEQAENDLNAIVIAGGDLQNQFEAANIRYVTDLNLLADRFESFSTANDEYERRQAVREFAETPYLVAAIDPDTALADAQAADGFSADAREEYRLAVMALDAAQDRLNTAALKLQSAARLDDLQTIVAGLENGETYAALTDDERDELYALRDRKFESREILSAVEETRLTELHLRETHETYGDLLAARSEHFRHSLRMIRVHKTREIVNAEIERRRAIAQERKQAFENELNTRFGIASADAGAIKARNGVYLRLAGMYENGTRNYYDEFRGWYALTPHAAVEGEPGKQASPILEYAIAQSIGNAIGALDQAAIQGFIAAGGALGEFAGFSAAFYAMLVKLGEMDLARRELIATENIFYPMMGVGFSLMSIGQALMASWFGAIAGAATYASGLATVIASQYQIAMKEAVWQGKVREAGDLRSIAYNASGTESVRRVREKQELYEQALADLEYFTKSPDLQTSKERIIQWGAQHADAKAIGTDAAGAELYRITDEDLVYLFDDAEGLPSRFVDSNGGALTLSTEPAADALNVGGVREAAQFRDAFGRRYDPAAMTAVQPGPLAGGTYRVNGLEYIRIKFTNHDGTWQYRYAPLIDDAAPDERVFDLGKILNLTTEHGQTLRDLRRDLYMAAGESAATGAGERALILNDRDAAFAALFTDAGQRANGGREFSGYRVVYEEYQQNQRDVMEQELAQSRALQLAEWDLREQELNDRFRLWERKTETLLSTGTDRWGSVQTDYLQKWRDWERQFDQKVEQGLERWQEKTREHFAARDAWETGIRTKAAEKSAEIVLTEAVQELNTQIRSVERGLAMDFDEIHAISAINSVIDDIRRAQPGKTQSLQNVNAGIADFNTRLALTGVTGANTGSQVAAVSGQFREQVRVHQQQMRTLANVKVFEQYRNMIRMFADQFEVQNQQIDDQTRAAAFSAGFREEGDLFIKTAGISRAQGVVNRYAWFDTQSVIDRELTALGFTRLDGNELFDYLEGKSTFEVDSYFQTQRQVTQTVFQKIVGTAPNERYTSRDASVIGLFGAWVGAREVQVDATLYAVDPADFNLDGSLLGTSIFGDGMTTPDRMRYEEAKQEADNKLAAARAGYGELGSGGQRPGGAALGFYPQLNRVSEDLAKQDQKYLKDLGGPAVFQALTGIFSGLNPAMWIANSAQNIAVATINGKPLKDVLWANILNVVKQAGAAIGSALAAASGVGLTMLVGLMMTTASNMIQVNPMTGETGFAMTEQAALSTMMSAFGAVLGPAAGGIQNNFASAVVKGIPTFLKSGMRFDANGKSDGFSLESAFFGFGSDLVGDAISSRFGPGDLPANAGFTDYLAKGFKSHVVSHATSTTMEYLKYELGGQWGRENARIDMTGGDLSQAGSLLGGAVGGMLGNSAAMKDANAWLADKLYTDSQKHEAQDIAVGLGVATQGRRRDWLDDLSDATIGEGGLLRTAGGWLARAGVATSDFLNEQIVERVGNGVQNLIQGELLFENNREQSQRIIKMLDKLRPNLGAGPSADMLSHEERQEITKVLRALGIDSNGFVSRLEVSKMKQLMRSGLLVGLPGHRFITNRRAVLGATLEDLFSVGDNAGDSSLYFKGSLLNGQLVKDGDVVNMSYDFKSKVHRFSVAKNLEFAKGSNIYVNGISNFKLDDILDSAEFARKQLREADFNLVVNLDTWTDRKVSTFGDLTNLTQAAVQGFSSVVSGGPVLSEAAESTVAGIFRSNPGKHLNMFAHSEGNGILLNAIMKNQDVIADSQISYFGFAPASNGSQIPKFRAGLLSPDSRLFYQERDFAVYPVSGLKKFFSLAVPDRLNMIGFPSMATGVDRRSSVEEMKERWVQAHYAPPVVGTDPNLRHRFTDFGWALKKLRRR